MFDVRNNLSALYDFYIVAKKGSFSKASQDNQSVSQGNLSKSVARLEEELKQKLIIRTNKGIKLTLDGEKWYKKLDNLFNSLNSNELGSYLTIGTTRNIADNKLLAYLVKFNNKYPKVKVRIITDSAVNLNNYLLEHKIDVLLDYLPNINNDNKTDIDVKAIGLFDTVFACSKEFYDKEKDNIKTLKDLLKYKLVIPGSSRRRQLLDEVLQANNLELNPIVEMPDSKLMIDFIKQTNSIGYFISDEVKASDLVILDLKEELPKNIIGIIYHKNLINNITKCFIELVLDEN